MYGMTKNLVVILICRWLSSYRRFITGYSDLGLHVCWSHKYWVT